MNIKKNVCHISSTPQQSLPTSQHSRVLRNSPVVIMYLVGKLRMSKA